MASFTVTTAPWLAGTAVDVYLAAAWVERSRAPSGPSLAQGTVNSQGTVTFTGLAQQVRHVAYAAGQGITFLVPAPRAATNLGQVQVNGTPAVGETLSVTAAPDGATYEWLRDDAAISGATSSSYVVQSADQGHTITCRVASESASVTVPAGPLPTIPEFTVISRGRPVTASNEFGGINAPANAVDGDAGSFWRSVVSPNDGTAQWITVDIRGLAGRDDCWLSFVNATTPTYVPPADPPDTDSRNNTGRRTLAQGSAFNGVPADYKWQGHASSSGTAPGAADGGWVDVVTVTENRWANRTAVGVDLSAYGYVRFRCTRASGVHDEGLGVINDDVSVQVQVRSASLAANGGLDSIVVAGTSIEVEGWRGRNVDNTVWPGQDAPIENQVEAFLSRDAPLVMNVSTSGWRADLFNDAKSTYLDPFLDFHVLVLSYGTNEANVANSSYSGLGDSRVVAFLEDMQEIIDYWPGVVVIPTIHYGALNAWTAGNVVILNSALEGLRAANTGKVLDLVPDLYTPFHEHPEALRDEGGGDTALHPSWDPTEPDHMVAGDLVGYETSDLVIGYAIDHRAWRDALAQLY